MNGKSFETGSPAPDVPGTSLPEPHFDDATIATAQPVEPLPDVKSAGWQKFGALRRHVSTTALLLILVGAVGFATVAFGLAGIHQRLNAEEPQAAITLPEQSNQTKTSDTSTSMSEKTQRPAVRKARPRVSNGSSKSAARMVGEIVYR
jgi:hypothetical protein